MQSETIETVEVANGDLNDELAKLAYQGDEVRDTFVEPGFVLQGSGPVQALIPRGDADLDSGPFISASRLVGPDGVREQTELPDGTTANVEVR